MALTRKILLLCGAAMVTGGWMGGSRFSNTRPSMSSHAPHVSRPVLTKPIPGSSQSLSWWPKSAKVGTAVPYLAVGSVTAGLGYAATAVAGTSAGLILAGSVALPMVVTLVEMVVLGGPRIAKMMGGTPADDKLRAQVVEVARRASMPEPAHVFEIDTAEKNAFAAGFFENDRTVVVTSGLRAALTDRELSAVLAHEMGHVMHSDVARNMHIAAAVAGLGGIYEAGRLMLRSDTSSKKDKDEKDNTAALGFGLMAVGLGTQVGAHLMRLGLGRSAEFRADAVAAELFGADAIISALRKIESPGATRDKLGSRGGAFAHLCIAPDPKIAAAERNEEPSSRPWWGNWRRWLSTHPSTQERVDALRNAEANAS